MIADKVSILGVPINTVTMEEAIHVVANFVVEKNKPRLIATANAEMVMLAQEDQELADILGQADLVVPDGAGVVWAARHYGYNMPERVAGYDMTQRLLETGAKLGYKVYFFGGAPGVAEKAKKTAESLYPGIKIVKARHGFFSQEEESEIINDIVACAPDILFVALGVPRQEKWLFRNMGRLGALVAIGVGGTFDVMAGEVKRAPVWMQRASLEWLYRLMMQPQRFIRMLALPKFAVKVITGKK